VDISQVKKNSFSRKDLEQALTMALVLAITAPTEKKSAAAVRLAEQFAQGLPPRSIERIKRKLEVA
jgi:enoyl-CoA hydratase/carnithine racemase